MLVERSRALTGLVLAVPDHVDRYEQYDYFGYVSQTLRWLVDVERAAQERDLPVASLAAAERAKVLAARDGLRPPELDPGRRPSRGRDQRATASLALGRVEQALRTEIERTNEVLNEAREKIAQLLAIASTTSPIPLPPSEPRLEWLRDVWQMLGRIDETKNLYAYLNVSLAANDRLQLLDELIENWLGEAVLIELSEAALTLERFEELVRSTFEKANISSAAALLEQGVTRAGIRRIAHAAEMTEHDVRDWVNRIDLMRVSGIGPEAAHLLAVTGIGTVKELRRRNPAHLYRNLSSVNEELRLVEQPPGEATVEAWIGAANGLDG